jgi:hypothetical protein
MIYYPTEETISEYGLSNYITDEDPWRMKIIALNPEILRDYPELARTTFDH